VPLQLAHSDGEDKNRQMEIVCRFQADQRKVGDGRIPNATNKLYPRPTTRSQVYQKHGFNVPVFDNSSGRNKQNVHSVT